MPAVRQLIAYAALTFMNYTQYRLLVTTPNIAIILYVS